MDELELIMSLFADDIKEYIALGGSLDNLNAVDVYALIDEAKGIKQQE